MDVVILDFLKVDSVKSNDKLEGVGAVFLITLLYKVVSVFVCPEGSR
jgi:hypothetical protein